MRSMAGGSQPSSPCHVADASQDPRSSPPSGPLMTRGSNTSSGSSTAASPFSEDVTSDMESGAPFPVADMADPPTHASKGPKTYDIRVERLTYCMQKGAKLGERRQKCLLKDVSVTANRGEILAVAGASGAGKTTLIDALAGLISPASLKGSILVNGQPIDSSFRRISGYVTQDDHLLPMLTVRETLLFSARLRLPSDVLHHEKVACVEGLIVQLGLRSCKDTLVGNADLRGISGGERRRTSIGVDLVHNPQLLFLDEPTSGLDSAAALTVMQTLKTLTQREQKTIILSIHQPSTRILRLIDRFLILWGGRVVYQGPYNGMSPYFEEIGGARDCQETNAVEFALDVMREADATGTKLLRSSLEQQKETGSNQQQASTEDVASLRGALSVQGTQSKGLNQEVKGNKGNNKCKDTDASGRPRHAFACSFFTEVLILSQRNVMTILRTKELFLARIFIFILCGVIAGTLFLNSGQDIEGANNRLAFFAYTVAAAFFTSTDAIPTFLEERWIYKRETSRGAYRPLSYVVSGALIYLPFLFVIAVTYSAISYYMVGLAPGFGNFMVFVITVFFSLAVANSFVCFVASVVPNFTLGSAVSTAFSALFLLFSGYFISASKIPLYWIWMNYISTFKYPLQLLVLNEFGGHPAYCWKYAETTGGEVTKMCAYSSQDVLDKFSIGSMSVGGLTMIMVLFYVGYRVLFYVMLRIQTSQRRD